MKFGRRNLRMLMGEVSKGKSAKIMMLSEPCLKASVFSVTFKSNENQHFPSPISDIQITPIEINKNVA